jgi:hypothetical protein
MIPRFYDECVSPRWILCLCLPCPLTTSHRPFLLSIAVIERPGLQKRPTHQPTNHFLEVIHFLEVHWNSNTLEHAQRPFQRVTLLTIVLTATVFTSPVTCPNGESSFLDTVLHKVLDEVTHKASSLHGSSSQQKPYVSPRRFRASPGHILRPHAVIHRCVVIDPAMLCRTGPLCCHQWRTSAESAPVHNPRRTGHLHP